MIFPREEDNGSDDVGKVRNKLSVKVCESEERTDAFDRRGRLPILDGREFGWVHAYMTLTDDHTKVFHGRGVKGTFRDLERKTVFTKASEDTTGALVV